jgi:hypothetical protein
MSISVSLSSARTRTSVVHRSLNLVRAPALVVHCEFLTGLSIALWGASAKKQALAANFGWHAFC